MVLICQVCLRTDKNLQTIQESLANWHDELCDFSIEDFVQFCAECTHLLRKFHDFKEKCLLATRILKNWKKQKEATRKPLHLLHKQIPPSPLGVCNRNNHKVYYYQAAELDTATPIEPPSFKHPHIVTVSVSTGENDNNTIENYNNTNKILPFHYDIHDTDTIKDLDVKIENELQHRENTDFNFGDSIVFEELNVKNDIEHSVASDNESDFSNTDIKRLINATGLKSDTESSDDEIIKPKKRRKTLADLARENVDDKTPKRTKRVRNKKPFNMESLKNMLLSRFASNGEVKDEDGNVIDKDCILNSLDKMHVYTLNQIRNRISGTNTLTQEAIQVLSRVQKKYGNQYSSVFTIEHLLTKEQIQAEFAKRQYHESYTGTEHKCTLCYRGFKHKKLLDYHVNTYHDPGQPHPCPVCQMRFRSRHALLKHRNGHRAVYKCNLCPLLTNYRTAMVNHYHQHKGMVYTCELCKGTFKSKSCLSAHMNYMHQSQYICGLCARTFASESGLSQHRLRKHAYEQPTVTADGKACEICNVTFISEEIYQKHFEKSHAEKKEHVYVYKKRNYVAPRQKPKFICRVCKAVEHSIGRLTWHVNKEHPTENFDVLYSDIHKHLCHVCGKGYASITDLNEHRHLHTGAKPYACDKCPKAFHRKINLRNHLERHLPPARECKQCGKKFVSAANLNNHVKMHIGERHYTCEICSKSFLHRSALNAHVRGVHHHIRRKRKPATNACAAD